MALLIGIGVNALIRALEYAHTWLKKHANFILAGLLTFVILGGIFDYFILAPRKYHPQPDQVMSWAVLNSRGESFAYIYQDPSQQDFKPYTVEEFRKSVPFQTVSYEDVINGKKTFSSSQKTVIFYPPELTAKIASILQVQLGTGLIQRTFYSTDGTPVLAAGMNTPFIFERDRPIWVTFLDGFQHPAFIIFLFVIIIASGSCYFPAGYPLFPSPCLGRPPGRLVQAS